MFKKIKKLITAVAAIAIMVTSTVSVSAQVSNVREFLENASASLVADNNVILPVYEKVPEEASEDLCTSGESHNWYIYTIMDNEPVYKCRDCRKITTDINHTHTWRYVGMSELFHTIRCDYCGFTKQSADLKSEIKTPNLDKRVENNDIINKLMNFIDGNDSLSSAYNSKTAQYKDVLEFVGIDYNMMRYEIMEVNNRMNFINCLSEAGVNIG